MHMQWRKDDKAGLHANGASAGKAQLPMSPLPPPPPPGGAAKAPAANPASVPPAFNCGPGILPIKGNIGSKGDKIYHVPGGCFC